MSADVLVLGYHAVSETWPWRFAVTPSALRAQLRHLRSRGYRSVTFAEALRERSGRVVAVTFDDAFRSVPAVAARILTEEGFRGTVFAVTDQLGCAPMRWDGLEEWLGTEHEQELEGASWDDLRELRRAGWEIGSHTRTHPPLTELSAQARALELEGSRAAVEAELDCACTSLAYPYGAVDDGVVAAAHRAGYVAAACFPPRFPRPRPLDWPRVGVYNDTTALRFAVGGGSTRQAAPQLSSPAGARGGHAPRRSLESRRVRLVVVTEYAGDPDDANRTWIDQLVAALEQGGDEARVHELRGDVHTAALKPRSLAGLRRHRADALLYVPFGGLTAAALVRLRLIGSVVPRARAGIAVLYSRKDVPRRLGPLVADIALFATPRLEGAFRHVARRRAVVPPAVDLERFSPVARAPRDVRRDLGLDDSRPLALHVGNFKPHRNVEALAALAREGRHVAMLASPRFAAAPGLVEELRSAGVDVRHEFVADLPQWYRAADVYVFPVADPLGATEVPQTVLEALACGTPVATTRFGALESLFSPEDRPGLVYAAPDELGAAIDVAAKEPRGAGRVLVEGFSSAALAETVRAAYRSA